MKKNKRNTKEIKKWLIDAGLTLAGIARDLKVSKTLVCLTLTSNGQTANNRKVLRYVVAKGCPAEILDLPADMRKAA